MAVNDRIKEARQKRNFTQEQLSQKIGVAKSTLAGYEKGIREPNMLTMSRIMESLSVDANYLYQDEMGTSFSSKLTYDENKTIEKYRALDGHGKKIVNMVLNEEYDRCADLDEMEIMEKMTPDERADYLAKLAQEFEEMHPNKKQAANE